MFTSPLFLCIIKTPRNNYFVDWLGRRYRDYKINAIQRRILWQILHLTDQSDQKNGFINLGPAAVKAVTLATDLNVADHAGRLVTMDPAGTPTAITIPSIVSTADSAIAGPGSDPNNANTIGTTFEILFTDNFTGTIKLNTFNDKFVGAGTVGIDASVAEVNNLLQVATNNELILNGEAGSCYNRWPKRFMNQIYCNRSKLVCCRRIY